jgi:hypothetical protein
MSLLNRMLHIDIGDKVFGYTILKLNDKRPCSEVYSMSNGARLEVNVYDEPLAWVTDSNGKDHIATVHPAYLQFIKELEASQEAMKQAMIDDKIKRFRVYDEQLVKVGNIIESKYEIIKILNTGHYICLDDKGDCFECQRIDGHWKFHPYKLSLLRLILGLGLGDKYNGKQIIGVKGTRGTDGTHDRYILETEEILNIWEDGKVWIGDDLPLPAPNYRNYTVSLEKADQKCEEGVKRIRQESEKEHYKLKKEYMRSLFITKNE